MSFLNALAGYSQGSQDYQKFMMQQQQAQQQNQMRAMQMQYMEQDRAAQDMASRAQMIEIQSRQSQQQQPPGPIPPPPGQSSQSSPMQAPPQTRFIPTGYEPDDPALQGPNGLDMSQFKGIRLAQMKQQMRNVPETGIGNGRRDFKQTSQPPQLPPYQSMQQPAQQVQQNQFEIPQKPQKDEFAMLTDELAKNGITTPAGVMAAFQNRITYQQAQQAARVAALKEREFESDKRERMTETGRHNKEMEANGRVNADANTTRSNKVTVSHGAAGLSDEQNEALFGANGAVTTGRLDPNRVNSRTAALFADATIRTPSTDFSKIHSDIALTNNAGFRQKAMVAETLPEIMTNMVTAGKKIGFSDNKTIGKMQGWVKGEFNDPDMTEYMTQRNDALMSIAGVMRGVGMTDMAHKAEVEVAGPTMSPDALDAWLRGQMKSLNPRLKNIKKIMREDDGAANTGSMTAERWASMKSGDTFVDPQGATRRKP